MDVHISLVADVMCVNIMASSRKKPSNQGAGSQARGRGGKATAAARAPERPAYHHGDLRRALVDAAAQLVAEGGSAALTVRAAAQAAGVSIAAPYRHFDDRAALLAAVLAEGFDELAARTEAARRAAPDARAALLAVGLAYVDFARERAALYRLMFSPECDKASYPELMAAGDRALGVLLGAVADVQAAGLIDAQQVQPLALAGWSLSHGLATLHGDGMFEGKIPGALQDNARAVMTLLLSSVLREAPLTKVGKLSKK